MQYFPTKSKNPSFLLEKRILRLRYAPLRMTSINYNLSYATQTLYMEVTL